MDRNGTEHLDHLIQRNLCRFPAHEYISGASKIPTIIYYDRAGNVKAVGAEAVKEGIYEIAEEEHWVKAEWYGVLIASQSVFMQN